MIRIFAPGPERRIPDATAAVQELERLLAEAGELHDRIASACTRTCAGATHRPAPRPVAARNARLAQAGTQNGSRATRRAQRHRLKVITVGTRIERRKDLLAEDFGAKHEPTAIENQIRLPARSRQRPAEFGVEGGGEGAADQRRRLGIRRVAQFKPSMVLREGPERVLPGLGSEDSNARTIPRPT